MKLTTTLVLGLTWSVATVLGQSLPNCSQEKFLERKNVHTMSSAELTRYFNAVKKLNSGTKPTKWDTFAKIHVDVYDRVHSNPQFLAWHRLYLYKIEKELQKIDPKVSIPYWDWTVYSQKPSLDPVFSERMFGGQGNSNTGCISNGQFKDFKAYYHDNGSSGTHCLRRNDDIFKQAFSLPELIDKEYLNYQTISEFAEKFEMVPHGSAHNNIGWDFSGKAAPSDPLFYSLHAFVDKLWYDYQNRHPNQRLNYHIPLNTILRPWNTPISEVMELNEYMCYYYFEDHFQWSQPSSRSLFPTSPLKAEPYRLPSNVTDPEAIRAFTLDYVSKNLTLAKVEDKTDLYKLRAPKPLPLKSIKMMNYDPAKVHEQERREHIFISNLNKIKSYVSPAAIVNLKAN